MGCKKDQQKACSYWLSGFANTISSYQPRTKRNSLYTYKKVRGSFYSNFISYFNDTCSKRPLTNSYLMVQFSCMAGTSHSCNHVRECWPTAFVLLTKFCLLTKTDFVCFLLMFFKYYTQMLYSDVVCGTIFSVNIYIIIKEELSKNYHELCVQRVWN